MKIFDRSMLALPFFDASHRKLATELEEWVSANQGLAQTSTVEDPADRGRRLTKLLGEAGWLKYVVDPQDRPRTDLRSICLIREAFAFLDDLVDFAFSIQGLGSAAVAWYGSAAQRERFLPSSLRGDAIAALSMSEPAGGSDLSRLTVSAQPQADGGYCATGEKSWVSNGGIADYYVVLLRTGPGPGALGLSLFAIPATTVGLSWEPVSVLAPRALATLRLEDCRLEAKMLLGELGHGFRYVTEILSYYRITVGAAALGFGRRALHATLPHVRDRVAGGGRLIESHFTTERLARMSLTLDSAALLVARAAWEFDTLSYRYESHASMAKWQATEGVFQVVDDAVQLFGAAGMVSGSVPERLYREIRSLRIYEGTSEIQKMIVAGALQRPC